VFKFIDVKRIVTWHKAFGSKSMKPLQILSSSGIIESLRRPKPHCKSASLAIRADGRYSGVKKRLVESQAYTPQFGSAVADMMVRFHLQSDV
jgi:hypothetical protein